MNYKVLSLVLLTVVFIIDLTLSYLNKKSTSLPIKDNVKDIYDEKEYSRWLSYNSAKLKIRLVDLTVDFVYLFAVLAFDAFAAVSRLSDNTNIQIIVVLTAYNLVNTIIKLPTSYINNIKIEQEYGFNKSTNKTFILDEIKGFILSDMLIVGLVLLFSSLYSLFGDLIIIIFTAVAVVILLLIAFLVPIGRKLFNKLVPLEEGSLRTKLTELLDKYGYKVSDIKVMDGSRRSTKANAYFSGIGKTKTIVLYDTMLDLMTEDEIVAVFAHELAHGKHKHIVKGMAVSIGQVFILVLTVFGMLKLPISNDFGFDSVSPSLIGILLFSAVGPFIMMAYGIFSSYISRRNEYQADALAAREGYGDALISALKKLTKNNFATLNPHPVNVVLSYSHPTLSDRIDAIERINSSADPEKTK